MKAIFLVTLRVIALAILFTVLLTLASSLTTPPGLAERMTPAQISQSTAALPVVSLIMTVMLAYLALRSGWHGWKLAGALFVIFYTLYSLLGWVELLAFPAVARLMPAGMMTGMLFSGLMVAGPFSLLAVWILGKARPDPAQPPSTNRLRMPAVEWIWKTAAGAALYVIIYFTFGYYVAWRTPGLPEFYGGTDPGTFLGQLANVMRDTPWLPALQLFRGLIWVGIGCLILGMHKGKPWEAILATGVAFTILMNAAMLFPNPFWPPLVAQAHTIELVSSNLLYGLLLAALLLWRPAQRVNQLAWQVSGK
jgi:hypothetical protein